MIRPFFLKYQIDLKDLSIITGSIKYSIQIPINKLLEFIFLGNLKQMIIFPIKLNDSPVHKITKPFRCYLRLAL